MLRVVGEFSAVTAVLLSLVRKFMSLFVSYALFPKRIGSGHLSGLALVFVSVFLHSFRRQLFAFMEKNKMCFQAEALQNKNELGIPLQQVELGSAGNKQDLGERGEIFTREHTADSPERGVGWTENKLN